MQKLVIFLIRFTSWFFRTLSGRACRFYPSCSRYAVEAYGHFGFLKATEVSLKRLLRCHPFSTGGYDPLGPRED